MLMILSPAKTLDFESSLTTDRRSIPACSQQAAEVIESLLRLSRKEIAGRMKLKPELAETTCRQFTDWQQKPTPRIARPAALAYRGNAFVGLDAATFSEDDFAFAQGSLRILSGLYGILRPLDLIQPYRLEMGTKLKSARGKDLYQFWGTRINEVINKDLGQGDDRVLVNLASNEYFKSVKSTLVEGRIVTPSFKEEKNGDFKQVTFFAKKARGLMTSYIIQNQLENVEEIKTFNLEGYRFNMALSEDDDWVFTRR